MSAGEIAYVLILIDGLENAPGVAGSRQH